MCLVDALFTTHSIIFSECATSFTKQNKTGSRVRKQNIGLRYRSNVVLVLPCTSYVTFNKCFSLNFTFPIFKMDGEITTYS